MSREKTLVKNTIIVAIGKICTQFISFFLLPLYTSILSAKEYGVVDLFNTYVSLLLPLIFFQIDQSIFRFLIDNRKNEDEKGKFISTTLYTVTIQSVLFLIVYLLISIFIHNEYKYYLALNVIASIFANIMLQISRGLGDNTTYSQGSLITGSGIIILNVVLLCVFKMGATGMLIAICVSNLLCSIFIYFKKKLYRYTKIVFYNKKYLKNMWSYSIPLVPNQLSWWIVDASDRSIITWILGVGMNGIYSAANKFSSICISLFNIFNLTWSESASMSINDSDSDEFFTKMINTTIKLFSCILIGIVAVMPFVFQFFITGKEFADAYFQIPILMLATIFNITVSLFGSIYVALKKTKEIAKTSIYAAIINIVINIVLINKIGLFAASISTFIAYLLMSIYRYFDLKKYVNIKIDVKYILSVVPIYLIITVLYYIHNYYLCFIGLLIIIIFSIYYNVGLMVNMFSFIKNKVRILLK